MTDMMSIKYLKQLISHIDNNDILIKTNLNGGDIDPEYQIALKNAIKALEEKVNRNYVLSRQEQVRRNRKE